MQQENALIDECAFLRGKFTNYSDDMSQTFDELKVSTIASASK